MLTKKMEKKLDFYLFDDAPKGDPTSSLLPNNVVTAKITAKENCTLAGIEEASYLFRKHKVKITKAINGGKEIKKNQVILKLKGKVKDILLVERIALNIIGRMSGIATNCRKAVKISKNYKVKIAITRKTSPGFMTFDKKAAKISGAWPHRDNLSDAILIKDNHLMAKNSPEELVKKALLLKKRKKLKYVEIEVENFKDAVSAINAGTQILMLDNFSPTKAKITIEKLRKLNKKVKIEISGGVNFSNLKEYCKAKPDIISLGALTRNVPILDFSLSVD